MPSFTPLVSNGRLELHDAPIAVGRAAWWKWLELPDCRTFRYGGAEPFTARREARADGHYWYGHRRLGGRLAKVAAWVVQTRSAVTAA